MIISFQGRARELYARYERWIPAGAFFLGFIFDMLTLRRVDEFFTINQQVIYLALAVSLITVELVELVRPVVAPRVLTRAWPFREFFFHFFLGTLLNSFTIFYFKSASTFSSFVFVVILTSVLILNEVRKFGKYHLQVRVGLMFLCVITLIESLAPIALGAIGFWPFMAGFAATVALVGGYYRFLRRFFIEKPDFLKSHVLIPYAVVQGTFLLLYFANAIPPVPLSVSYMGIYHQIEKKEGAYHLGYTRPLWKFWQNGDETFMARPGDALYCFAQVYAPARFKGQLQVRWLHKDEKRGWEPQDAIPLEITGGREQGYRAVTKKSHYKPGVWRVQIETENGQEVGRLKFEIIADEGTDPRTTHLEVR